MIVKLNDVSLWKLFGIVAHCFIDALGLHAVQFGDIAIEDDLLVAQGDDPTKTTNHQKGAFLIVPDFGRIEIDFGEIGEDFARDDIDRGLRGWTQICTG